MKIAARFHKPLLLLLLLCLCAVQGQDTVHLRVVENSATDSVVGRVHDSAEETSSSNRNYQFTQTGSVNCGTYFNIDQDSSLITVGDQVKLDREAIVQTTLSDVLNCFVSFDVTSDLGAVTQHNIPVSIRVLDENDCTPHFFGLTQPHHTSVLENVAIPTPVLLLQPTDDDNGVNGTTQFSITRGNEASFFMIDLAEGDTPDSTPNRVLFLIRQVNFEDFSSGQNWFNLTITITDMAPSQHRLSFEQIVNISVVNLEDEPPTFEMTSYKFEVAENQPLGAQEVFGTVLAGSEQSSGQVFYNICSTCSVREPANVVEIIGVNQVTGGLFLRMPADYEAYTDPRFVFEVEASNPNTRETVTTNVVVRILNVNEHPPFFTCLLDNLPALMPFECSTEINVNNTVFYIEENSTISAGFLLQFPVEDRDQTALFRSVNTSSIASQIQPEDNPFNPRFGQFGPTPTFGLELEQNAVFDREQTPIFTVTLTVENEATPKLTTVTNFSIKILDINDNHPQFLQDEYKGQIPEGSPAGVQVMRVEARDPDEEENGTVTYSITDIREEAAREWFQISPESGVISVRDPSTSYLSVRGSVTLTVTASDNGALPLSASTEVIISILPSATFVSGSYQEYSGADFNLLSGQPTSFYFEFRSSEGDGLLAYQRDPSSDTVFSVELREGGVVARLGAQEAGFTQVDVATDSWHSVHVEISGQEINLTVTEVDYSSDVSRLALLQNLNIQRCVNSSQQQTIEHQTSLYIGGVNLFLLPPNTTVRTPRFVGGIRNVVVEETQLDLTCPAAEVNTVRGVVRSNGCEEMSCSSNRTSQCVDYAEESFCQCLGGFSSAVCSISETSEEIKSYAPIRFLGNTRVQLNLGYSFFYDLQVQKTPGGGDDPPGVGTGTEGAGEGENSAPGERRRKKRGGARRERRNVVDSGSGSGQVVEMLFRLAEQRSGVLLYSRTASSVHLIRVEHTNITSLKYTIWSRDQPLTPVLDLSINDLTFQDKTEYSVRATISTDEVSLSISNSDQRAVGEWSERLAILFAEQPETDISIGGAAEFFNASDLTFDYFKGCISRVSIDGIELPLSGLLNATSEVGGFVVEDNRDGVSNTKGVENYCDLCDLEICPEQSVCVSTGFGDVTCECERELVKGDGGKCVTPPVLTPTGLSTPVAASLITYMGAGVGAGVLVLLVVICIISIVLCRRRREKKKKTYSISNSSNGFPRSSSQSNPYTPTTPKRRPSLTSPPNPSCTTEITNERGSSVSTFQEHDGEPESPSHPSAGRTRHTSVESGIKMDMDQETSIGRGIPRMEDSGHEVNSSDSARSEVSEDIASEYSNEQLPPRPSISIRMMGGMASPDQCSPHTPLTPKEQKIRIPLRPDSTNLSQSELDDEVTDTESYNTRVSSSSGAGGSMQNQGRGSDSESSKISGLQWYKSSTNSDTERENERIKTTRPYYPLHSSAAMKAERGDAHRYQPRYKQGQPLPPTYYSPPTFSDHINGVAYRERSKSLRATPATKSPLAKTPPRGYENYPQPTHRFPSDSRDNRSVRFNYETHRPDLSYGNHAPKPRHERQHSDPRMLNDDEYSTTTTSFSRQYSDPRIPRNGNYCIPRKPSEEPREHILHTRQMSDPHVSSQQTQDSLLVQPRSSRSLRHITSPGAYSPPKRPSALKDPGRPYFTLGRTIPDHMRYQPSRSFSTSDAPPSEEPSFHTLNHIAKIDPISNYEAQDRMKIAVDHMDHMDPLAYHLLSGPCMQFEDVSTDPSVIESQLTMDESVMGEQVFESQGGGEGTADMLDPLDMRLARLREDEIDSILTDSEVGRHVMNHFPSADCSSQYTATIVAGSTSTSGESTPKMQKVFVMPSQQSFDV